MIASAVYSINFPKTFPKKKNFVIVYEIAFYDNLQITFIYCRRHFSTDFK